MNRIINDPEQVADEAIRGVVLAYPDILTATDHPRVLRATRRRGEGKVGIVTGGGSGHEPAFLGFVGAGLCDAVACGEIFASPTAKSFHEALQVCRPGRRRRLPLWQLCRRQYEREDGGEARRQGRTDRQDRRRQ